MNLPDASLSPTPWTPPWHLVVHHLASEPQASTQRAIAGRSLKVLQLEPWQQSHEFHRTFDGVLAAINTELGGYVEGDGSFVWRPQPGPDGSFVEGNLDGDQNLRHVELKGRLSRGDWSGFSSCWAGRTIDSSSSSSLTDSSLASMTSCPASPRPNRH
ncbi:MAG: hypothetical protein R3B96_20515 [Pirellulaceae bacterium]